MYLSPLIDLHSNAVISYTVSMWPNLNLVMDMLEKALESSNYKDLTLHSDQGWHYQRKKYREKLLESGIRMSMSRKANCLDNSMAENLFSHLKTEFFYKNKFSNIKQFEKELHEYIEYYNNERI